jgi:ribosomal protein L29
MKAKEIREKNPGEMTNLLHEKKEKIRKIRFDISSKQVKNHREIRKEKKDVARIMTILSENN